MIEQIRVGHDNFCYLIYCERTLIGAVVDPGMDASKSKEKADELGVEIKYIICTHHHYDHCSEAKALQEMTGAKIAATEYDGEKIDGANKVVQDEDVLMVGDVMLQFLSAPGHTPGGMCIIVNEEALLTGDTLFIGDCGRCDLGGGDPRAMFDTLQRIKALPDRWIVYPGHDYGDKPYDTLGEQKRTNKVLLAKTYEEFAGID